MKFNPADHRFMCWLADYCSPFGAEVKRISTVIARPERRGFIAVHGKRVALTGIGWHALIANGHEPTTENGDTLAQLIAKGTPEAL